MPNGINVNIDKLPESPWFWVLVAIGTFLVLLATGHIATAVVFLFLAVAIICLIANIISSEPSPALWWVCVVCFLLALILGIIFVPSEWQPQVTPTLPLSLLAKISPLW